MAETTEQVSDSPEPGTEETEEPKEWIEQAQDEADRQAHEITELPEQGY